MNVADYPFDQRTAQRTAPAMPTTIAEVDDVFTASVDSVMPTGAEGGG